jgi:hypothetical protein
MCQYIEHIETLKAENVPIMQGRFRHINSELIIATIDAFEPKDADVDLSDEAAKV